MKRRYSLARMYVSLGAWTGIAAAAFVVDRLYPGTAVLPSGLSVPQLVALLAGLLALANLMRVLSHPFLRARHKPFVETVMVGRVYQFVAILVASLGLAYGLGKWDAFWKVFTLYGGLILGWSLQAPVSGLAAALVVMVTRPFRPGDRVRSSNYGWIGDVISIGPFYTVLNAVGVPWFAGMAGEEATGCHVLVPSAILLNQVAINYTVEQMNSFMLDEVIVRITFDSDWELAESIMLEAARDITSAATAVGKVPYIRADSYDYGIYLRLRYWTKPIVRAKTMYELNKRIYTAIKNTPSIDVAIPYIYSYKSAAPRPGTALPEPVGWSPKATF